MKHQCGVSLSTCSRHPKWSVLCLVGDIWKAMGAQFAVYPPNAVIPECRFETYEQAIRYAQDRAKMKR